MRAATVTALACLALAAFAAPPAAAFERTDPAGAESLLIRIADKAETPRRRLMPPVRNVRYQGPWYDSPYWLQRTISNRWLHFHYVNSGYPVRHVYRGVVTSYYPPYPVRACCVHHRHW